MKYCYVCKTKKDFASFYKSKSKKDGFTTECIPCTKKINKIRYQKNKQNALARAKAYATKNKEKIAQYQKYYRIKNATKLAAYEQARKQIRSSLQAIRIRRKFKSDPKFRAIVNARNRVNKFLRNKTKFSKSLGCSWNIFVDHIQSRFRDGMSWENYGKWEIDHVVPLSVAYEMGQTAFQNACLYTNLQPLWLTENRKKGDRYGVQP